MEFWFKLFDGSDFPARFHCGNWTKAHGYLHIVSDGLIFLAYMTIPLLIATIVRRRRGALPAPFPKLAKFFVAFIVCCGITHLNESIIFFHPFYRWAGVMKLVTAIVSWSTVLALAPSISKIIELKTPHELELMVERTRAELLKEQEAVQAAESLFRIAVEASPSAMISVDEAGRIVLANAEAARIFGYDRTELVGRSVSAIMPDGDHDADASLRPSLFQDPEERRMGQDAALSGRRKDGTVFPLELGLKGVETPHGRVVLAAIIDRSESEAKRRELELERQELERSNQELDDFATAVSHDLRAPLRAIRHAALWVGEELEQERLSPTVREHLDLLRGRAARMELLLDALFAYARVGVEGESVEEVDFEQVARDVVSLAVPPESADVHIQGKVRKIRAVRVLLERVLFNLVTNALKHSEREHVALHIEAREEEGGLLFWVRDNGVGIEPRFSKQIFRMFHTLKSRDERESAGVGLALVMKIVQREGGKIWLESTPGEGAAFFVEWPERGA